ncbi:hypothetical protein [Arthrobacter sp. NPDC056493]|uniref:hypothetical protein n=1 Tax=Arthrobacter sp. NPDC056493 TaxID=3345839 RepID=UPI00366F9CDB
MRFYIRAEYAQFHEAAGGVYRQYEVVRLTRDRPTGLVVSQEQIIENKAQLVHDGHMINAPIFDAQPQAEAGNGTLAQAMA